MAEFTHLAADGSARMVDVSERSVTDRASTAEGKVLLASTTVEAIRDAALPKGDVISTARLAGIMADRKSVV